MSKNNFVTVTEMSQVLGLSHSYCYKIIRDMNEELKSKGYMTFSGRVSRTYFNEKVYGDANASL